MSEVHKIRTRSLKIFIAVCDSVADVMVQLNGWYLQNILSTAFKNISVLLLLVE